MDNLESHTYEVFEKDPVKYSEYQKAIFCALRDRVSDSEAATRVTCVVVDFNLCVICNTDQGLCLSVPGPSGTVHRASSLLCLNFFCPE